MGRTEAVDAALENKRWQAETKYPLADPALLKKLTDEHDALSGTNRRSTEGGWKYLRYLHSGRF